MRKEKYLSWLGTQCSRARKYQEQEEKNRPSSFHFSEDEGFRREKPIHVVSSSQIYTRHVRESYKAVHTRKIVIFFQLKFTKLEATELKASTTHASSPTNPSYCSEGFLTLCINLILSYWGDLSCSH